MLTKEKLGDFSENMLVAGKSRPSDAPVQVGEPGYIDMHNWRLHSKLPHN
jgi:hypothetical protein